MAKITRFEDIDSWRKSRELTKSIYRITLNRGSRATLACVIRFEGQQSRFSRILPKALSETATKSLFSFCRWPKALAEKFERSFTLHSIRSTSTSKSSQF